MIPAKKLPPDLIPEILTRAGQGFTTRQISEWLFTDHAVKYSHASVANLLKATRTERADVAKEVVREHLGRHLNRDLERLETIRAAIARKVRGLGRKTGKDAIAAWARLLELEVKVIDRKLHYAGADVPDDPDDAIALAGQRLAGKLDRLLAESSQDSGEPEPA